MYLDTAYPAVSVFVQQCSLKKRKERKKHFLFRNLEYTDSLYTIMHFRKNVDSKAFFSNSNANNHRLLCCCFLHKENALITVS